MPFVFVGIRDVHRGCAAPAFGAVHDVVVDERERVQAWDFGRARSAMTLAERMAFRKALKNSYQVYVPDVAAAQ